jgi:NAD(P)-dependent dehydrogenase (short-subunit alcohol dehydrogenase family)
VLVTRAGRGFGHASARALGSAGATVIVIDPDADAAALVASEVEEAGAEAIPIKADFAVQPEVIDTFAKVLEIYGSIAGMVHVADGASNTPFRRLGTGEWGELMDSHARSTFLALQALARNAKGAWSTVILPPADALEPQTRALRDLLCGMVEGIADLGSRANTILPSRASAGAGADALVGEAALTLALPQSKGVSGASLRVTLPALPDMRESLPPEAFERG